MKPAAFNTAGLIGLTAIIAPITFLVCKPPAKRTDADHDAAVVIVLIGAVILLGLIAAIPGQIAERRGHPNASAILVCGLCGLILPPFWLVALIWAYTSG